MNDLPFFTAEEDYLQDAVNPAAYYVGPEMQALQTASNAVSRMAKQEVNCCGPVEMCCQSIDGAIVLAIAEVAPSSTCSLLYNHYDAWQSLAPPRVASEMTIHEEIGTSMLSKAPHLWGSREGMHWHACQIWACLHTFGDCCRAGHQDRGCQRDWQPPSSP